MDMTLRPMTQTEQAYCYSQSQQISGQTGLIGHLRADFGSNGTGFYANFFDFRESLKSEDFTAAAIVFELPDGRIGIVHHSWVPEAKIRRGNGREEKDWDEWIRRGWLTVVPGEYVKYGPMVEWFKEMRSRFEIKGIGFDPYNSMELQNALRAEGFLLSDVRQGPLTLNAPMKSFKEQLLDGNVAWNHDEMFTWYLRNVRLRADFFDLEKENWMPTKKNRFLKIDGFMAAMDAYVLRLRDMEMASSFWDDSHVLGGLL